MSYCRWSSNDHQCDVYVWADVSGGWRTEVAVRRPVFDKPMPPLVTLPVGEAGSPERAAWVEALRERDRLAREAMGPSDYVPVPDPPGGRSFWHATPGECADNLEVLASAGINVPPAAVAALRAEHAELHPTTPAQKETGRANR